ncbi:MAG: hypothetical protein Q8M08_14485 [Bacteroidales bacterium]|nr:hypothetical protein [Bacteroidales bacterium]
MSENNIQEQISELNRKLDMILENIEQQRRNREKVDDLVADLSIVAKDAFHHTVVMLDKSQVDFDHSGIPMLLIKILQNIDTFYEMLEMLESARDFMKDISPILHQVGLDAVNKMNEFDQKGYFEIIRNLTQPDVIAALGRTSKALAETKMDEKLDNRSLFGLLKQINSPDVRRSLSYTLRLVQAMQPEKGNSR